MTEAFPEPTQPTSGEEVVDYAQAYRDIAEKLAAGDFTSMEAVNASWAITDLRNTARQHVAVQIPRIFNNKKEQ
jgi:hypothetical protein